MAAVGHIHSRGIVHRNLKPRNILLQKSDHDLVLKLIGFDTACLVNGDQFLPPVEKSVFNSPPGHSFDPKKNDIWGIGCVFFYLLSGEEFADEFKINVGNLTKDEEQFLKRCLDPIEENRANIYDLEADKMLHHEIRPCKRKVSKCISKAVIEKIANLLQQPVQNISKRCHEQRFDEVSAMYNMILSDKLALQKISDIIFKPDTRPSTAPTKKSSLDQKSVCSVKGRTKSKYTIFTKEAHPNQNNQFRKS